MGIGPTGAVALFMARRRGATYRSTLTIGRQHLFLSDAHLAFMQRLRPRLPDNQLSAFLGHEYGEGLFRALGAKTVESLDASAYEGATIIHDLNQPVDERLKLAYSVVADLGALEHIFNVPAALKNCIDMVEIGGWYIYVGPCNNMMGHGFYQFSPELFFNFLAHNGFDAIEIFITVDYNPVFFRVADPRFYGARVELLNDEAAQIVVLARKAEHLRDLVCPIQSDYARSRWRGDHPTPLSQSAEANPSLLALIAANKKTGSALLQSPKWVAPQFINGFENTLQYLHVDPFEA